MAEEPLHRDRPSEPEATDASARLAPAADGEAVLELGGNWRIGAMVPEPPPLPAGLARLIVRAERIGAWDSALLLYARRLVRAADAAGVELRGERLPGGLERLLRMAGKPLVDAPPQPGAGLVARLGSATLAGRAAAADVVRFVGEVTLALARLIGARAQLRGGDLLFEIRRAGPSALPIVGLIALLAGVILAFVGATQLALFGAEIFVANVVAVGMLREMGALMAGVIMAGRTGAAYAAEIGTMQVNEEVDALQTLGVPPTEFLVLPRVLALSLTLPLLALYANVLGILGGAFFAVVIFGIAPIQYFHQSLEFLALGDLVAGLIKAAAFGVLIAIAGCYQGIRCGRSALAVGRAATAAVVAGIVAIVVADALLTVLFYVIGL